MILQADAKQLILDEFDRWWSEKKGKPGEATGNDGFAFYVALEGKNHPALNFHNGGDKWQEVHAWLRRSGRVK